MTWLSYLRGVMSRRGEKRRKSSGQQGDGSAACPSSSAATTSTTTTTMTTSAEAPPLIIPLLLTSAPPSQPPPQQQPPPPRIPPLPRVPTDIITATEKGMIGGSLCLPSSSSTASSQGHEFEARDVVGYTDSREGTVLTRAEEACGGEGRKSSWTGERGRCVMFKGVDV